MTGKKRDRIMEPFTMWAAVTAVIDAAGTVLAAWVRGRTRRQPARDDESLPSPAGCLPPGSRVTVLGGYGLVIEAGTATGRELPPDDHQ
jgi:hypothetical protein